MPKYYLLNKMGKIGFIFDIELDENYNKENIFFNLKPLNEHKSIIVFLEFSKLQGNYLVGKRQTYNKDESIISFMDKFADFEELLILEDSTFKHAKISLSQKTIIDFKYLTFWFNSKKYRELFELLSINQIDVQADKTRENKVNINNFLKTRVLEIITYFGLN